MDEVPAELKDRPFTVAEARSVGVTPRQLEHARFRRLFRGVYIGADREIAFGDWLRAALLTGPSDAIVSHRSAQQLYGPELTWNDDRIHLSTRRNAVCREDRIRVHRRKHAISSRVVNGLPVTSPARTFVDCALRLTFVQLVVFGDWLIQRGLVTFDELLAYCHDRHLDGVVAARHAMRYLVADSRSPMETLVRLILVLAGLPEPAVNSVVFDEVGRKVATVDLLYVRFRVAIEYDGRWHELSPDERRWLRDRRERLERLGWTVITVFDTDLPKPTVLVARVHDALTRGGYRGPRPQFTRQWRAMVHSRL